MQAGVWKKKSINKSLKTNFVEVNEEILNCDSRNYEPCVRKEVEGFLRDIKVSLQSQCLQLSSQLEPWLQ